MPDIFGNLTEEELRGTYTPPPQGLLGYTPPTRAELEVRDAAARAGNGTFAYGANGLLTGDAFRNSTDPFVVAERNRMLQGGRSDPNLLFGGTDGRTQSDAERQYREQYSNFMNNPNDGVSGSEAARAVGLWALAPIAGYALGPAGAGAGAAGAAAPAAAPVAGGGGGLLAGGSGVAAGASAALPEIVVTGLTGGGITAGEALLAGAGAAGTAALNAPSASSPNGFNGYGDMGGFQPNSGNGVFSNGGQGGMADVGAGNMGSLVNSYSAGGGGLLSGLMDNLGDIQGLLGGGQSQGGGGNSIVINQGGGGNNALLMMQIKNRRRAQELRQKRRRTQSEEDELRELSGAGV